ncbi:MAG: hypothetical protein RRY25_01140 [Anaerovorax sp.]
MKNCFGNNCGTSIDIRDIDFANPSPNLVYMDKVFSRRKSSSCPLMTELNTGEGCSENFVVELATYGGVHTNECHCGCDSGCDSVVIGTPPVFNVEKSYVEMEYFNNYPPGHTECMHASFDGVHTCSINYTNGRYLINTANSSEQNIFWKERSVPMEKFAVSRPRYTAVTIHQTKPYHLVFPLISPLKI